MLPALQFGVPGAPELIVIFLVLVLLGLPLVAVLALAVIFLNRRGGDDERVEQLQAEVERLRAEVKRLRGEEDADAEQG